MNMSERGDKIEVSREVLADLACKAALEVEGVTLCHQPTGEAIAARMKGAFFHRGVRVSEEKDGSYGLDMHLRVQFGTAMPEVSRQVKERVREFVERMTETRISRVEVVIEDLDLPDTDTL
jgi:uncharacterized alkaline shock family protein YloU